MPIKLPMVDVHTVSAGGRLDHGPAPAAPYASARYSTGAEPGPAYDMGGKEPTVTDANLFLGYLADGAELGGEVVLRR